MNLDYYIRAKRHDPNYPDGSVQLDISPNQSFTCTEIWQLMSKLRDIHAKMNISKPEAERELLRNGETK